MLLLTLLACTTENPGASGTASSPEKGQGSAHGHGSDHGHEGEHAHAAEPAKPAPAADHGADHGHGDDHGHGGDHGHGEEAGGDHGHAAKHGGIQKELDGMHLEALAMPTGVMFWPTDGDDKPIAASEFTGTATIKGPSGVTTVPLTVMGDHLHALTTLTQGAPATIVATITRAGKGQSATFEVPAVGLESHDHTALHGGQVGMWGDLHVEYVGTAGEHRFWVTDEHRVKVPGPISGSVKDGDKTLPLTVDADQGMLKVAANGAGSRPVSVDITAGGKTFTLSFNASKP